MTPDIIERYLIEIILLGGFFLAGPLARIIADAVTEEAGEERNRNYRTIRTMFRILFAALIVLSVLLFKTIFPLLK
jgi:hypothetical protein